MLRGSQIRCGMAEEEGFEESAPVDSMILNGLAWLTIPTFRTFREVFGRNAHAGFWSTGVAHPLACLGSRLPTRLREASCQTAV